MNTCCFDPTAAGLHMQHGIRSAASTHACRNNRFPASLLNSAPFVLPCTVGYCLQVRLYVVCVSVLHAGTAECVGTACWYCRVYARAHVGTACMSGLYVYTACWYCMLALHATYILTQEQLPLQSMWKSSGPIC